MLRRIARGAARRVARTVRCPPGAFLARLTLLSLSDTVELSLSDTQPEEAALHMSQAEARLAVSRHACALFWERGVAGTSGDDIAAAAGLSTRTIWRYFRSKEACVEPLLAKSVQRFIGVLDRWPPELSLGE